jgi:hypothetical protein
MEGKSFHCENLSTIKVYKELFSFQGLTTALLPELVYPEKIESSIDVSLLISEIKLSITYQWTSVFRISNFISHIYGGELGGCGLLTLAAQRILLSELSWTP